MNHASHNLCSFGSWTGFHWWEESHWIMKGIYTGDVIHLSSDNILPINIFKLSLRHSENYERYEVIY